MSRAPEPLFLARRTYRRRRLMDAARLLPVLGLFIFLLPLVWGEALGTARAGLALVAAWVFLIVLAGALARALTLGWSDEGAPQRDAPAAAVPPPDKGGF
ncbi:MAG: hypothetical protein AAFR35_15680 [Pseudomonadota bacterium]